jgi:hypothetical protein
MACTPCQGGLSHTREIISDGVHAPNGASLIFDVDDTTLNTYDYLP